jgi:hypothetical protein
VAKLQDLKVLKNLKEDKLFKSLSVSLNQQKDVHN